MSAGRFGAAFVLSALLLTACGRHEPYPYPEQAERHFLNQCGADSAVCECTWDEITRTMTYDEYQAAMQRFKEEGAMDHKLTHAKTVCAEKARREHK